MMAGKTGADDECEDKTQSIETRVSVLFERLRRVQEKIDLKFSHIDTDLEARDKALQLQATIDKEHFTALNHEAQRILKATEITVSRDTWTEFLKSFTAWQAATDRTLQNMVTRNEFQAYKEATQTALTLKAGQSQGIGMSVSTAFSLISTIASLAAILAFAFTLFRH